MIHDATLEGVSVFFNTPTGFIINPIRLDRTPTDTSC
jgi:hypothetical protein